jgi:predicted transcriptional regulator
MVRATAEEKKKSKEAYRIYVRQSIDAGICDADAGRVVSVEKVRAKFGLPPAP